jgi:hypothetical protein
MRKEWRERLRKERGEGRSSAPLGNPQHWRARAQAARAKVERGASGRSTHRLRLLADTYDRLADRMEVRLGVERGD